MATTISKKLKRFCFRLANSLLITSTLTLAGNLTIKPPAGYAQQIVTGAFNSPELGISLTLPYGWQGQLSDEALVLSSPNESGGIILALNQATSVEDLVQAANAGFYEQGIQLRRSGEFQQVGYNGVGAEFSGTVQGNSAKAFIAGVINPYGESVTILAIAASTEYDARKQVLVKEIAQSMRFSAPQGASVSSSGGDDVPVIIDIHEGMGCSSTTIGPSTVSNC